MTYPEFAEQVKTVYMENFPHSEVRVYPFQCFGKSAVIDCYLAAGKSERFHGYEENDMMHVKFWIDLPRTFDFEADEMPVTGWTKQCAHYLLAPDEPYYAYSMRKIPGRVAGKSIEAQLKSFGKFCAKMRQMMVDDLAAGKIADSYRKLAEKKLQ